MPEESILAENEKFRVKIIQDFDPQNPRDDDNLGTMICFHSRYNLGDKHDFKSVQEFKEWWMENAESGVTLPLYLYDHSGVTMSTGPFSCPWDSGQVGWIYVTAETIKQEFPCKRTSKKIRNKVIAILEAEVQTYDQFLTGDIWGFEIERKEDDEWEHADSCWGFYGHDPKENYMWEHWSEEIRKLVNPNYEINPDGYFLDAQLELGLAM